MLLNTEAIVNKALYLNNLVNNQNITVNTYYYNNNMLYNGAK